METDTVGPAFKFQGKKIRREANSCYWFMWGDMEFDIRSIREYFGKKSELQRDWNYRLNLPDNGCCPAFKASMRQLEKMVGNVDFSKILNNIKYDIKNGQPF